MKRRLDQIADAHHGRPVNVHGLNATLVGSLVGER